MTVSSSTASERHPAQATPEAGFVRLGLTDEQILARIDPTVGAIAITNMFSFNWPALRELIRAIRTRHPGKTIVCGGEHFSALPELCMQSAPIDYIVMGEGEEIAAELFAHLGTGAPFDPATVRGICWRRPDGEVVRNQRAERTKQVDQIPWPAWDLFDLDAYNDQEEDEDREPHAGDRRIGDGRVAACHVHRHRLPPRYP